MFLQEDMFIFTYTLSWSVNTSYFLACACSLTLSSPHSSLLFHPFSYFSSIFPCSSLLSLLAASFPSLSSFLLNSEDKKNVRSFFTPIDSFSVVVNWYKFHILASKYFLWYWFEIITDDEKYGMFPSVE